MDRWLSILFAVCVALGVLFHGSAHGGAVCLGGCHEHERSAFDAQELAHDDRAACVCTRHSDRHDERCYCRIVLTASLTAAAPSRAEHQPVPSGCGVLPDGWGLLKLDDGLRTSRPPRAPPWFDPGGEQRLVVIACVCLIV